MRINRITSTNFKAVTPIIVKNGSIDDIKRIFEKKANGYYYLQDATSLYKDSIKTADVNKGTLRKEAQKGHKIGLLVTGDDYGDMICLKKGWFNDPTAPSMHINRAPVTITKNSNKTIEMLLNRIDKYI